MRGSLAAGLCNPLAVSCEGLACAALVSLRLGTVPRECSPARRQPAT